MYGSFNCMSIALFDKVNPAKEDRGFYFFHIYI